MTKRTLVTLDDLYCFSQLQILNDICDAHPDVKPVVFTIPNKFGRIHDYLQKRLPRVTFAIHGFEHTPFECRDWHPDKARVLIQRALDMGYAPIFKAPNWIHDADTEAACRDLNVTLCIHQYGHVSVPGLSFVRSMEPGREGKFGRNLHSHITRNPVTTYVLDMDEFQPDLLAEFAPFAHWSDWVEEHTGEND